MVCPLYSASTCDSYEANITEEESSLEFVTDIRLRDNVTRSISVSLVYISGLKIYLNHHHHISNVYLSIRLECDDIHYQLQHFSLHLYNI